MKIQQAEELAGISKKNIRFYEQEGLLNVSRAANGYREYSLEDVERLKLIKLLRKLDLSLEDIKAICEKRRSLRSCLEVQTEVLARRSRDYEKMSSFCDRLARTPEDISSLQPDVWLEQMEQFEKEGATFMDVNKNDIRRKKTLGVLGAVAVTVLLFGCIMAMVIWGNAVDPVPKGIFWFIIAILAAVIIGVVAAALGRMKEIKGGEEDEASKY